MWAEPANSSELSFKLLLSIVQLDGIVEVLDFFATVGVNDRQLVAGTRFCGSRFATDELTLPLEEKHHMTNQYCRVGVVWGVTLALAACSSILGSFTRAQQGESDAAVHRVLEDYIGLYKRDALDRWKGLFLPGFTATYTNDDGSITTRTLEEFYDRQRNAFAQGEVSETLHNVRVQREGRLAHVFADFRFTSRAGTRPGQLMLLMIEERGQLKIAALTFTYHLTSGVR